jgi:hypothetical protein
MARTKGTTTTPKTLIKALVSTLSVGQRNANCACCCCKTTTPWLACATNCFTATRCARWHLRYPPRSI